MARFGTWRPLSSSWAAQARMTQVDIISIHTMVGSLAGTDSQFRKNGYGGTFSHFGIGGRGECTQWQDTLYRAAANYNGNWHIVSVECADVGAQFPVWDLNDGSAVPAFSPEQCETLAQLIASLCKAHGIPCVLIPDAKPGRRGIGYHRLGVPGFMVAGAEQWSTANRKVCPGDRRIAQIPAIVARASQILAGEGDNELGTQQAAWLYNSADNSGEARRMLGVILGWNAPATDNERAALVKLYGAGNVPDVDEAALAAALVNRLPSLDLGHLSDADVERIAEASAARIGKKLTAA